MVEHYRKMIEAVYRQVTVGAIDADCAHLRLARLAEACLFHVRTHKMTQEQVNSLPW